MEEEYREIELFETQLRVYRNGDIWRVSNGCSKGCKKGEWVVLKGHLNTGYLRAQINNKQIYLHRIIGMVYLGLDLDDKTQEIDHKNRIRTDNRLENLHIVNRQQNNWNNGGKGYYFRKKLNKYQASIRLNKKLIHLGCYDTEEEASNAYQSAKRVHHSF